MSFRGAYPDDVSAVTSWVIQYVRVTRCLRKLDERFAVSSFSIPCTVLSSTVSIPFTNLFSRKYGATHYWQHIAQYAPCGSNTKKRQGIRVLVWVLLHPWWRATAFTTSSPAAFCRSQSSAVTPQKLFRRCRTSLSSTSTHSSADSLTTICSSVQPTKVHKIGSLLQRHSQRLHHTADSQLVQHRSRHMGAVITVQVSTISNETPYALLISFARQRSSVVSSWVHRGASTTGNMASTLTDTESTVSNMPRVCSCSVLALAFTAKDNGSLLSAICIMERESRVFDIEFTSAERASILCD